MATLHICNHCEKPTVGALVLMPGEIKPTRMKMCQECWDYIGSPAAQQEGATMKNRVEMERQYKKAVKTNGTK